MVTGVLHCMASKYEERCWYCIVSIIDLVEAVGVGVITLTQKQVAAGMVTGVLYCMASKYEEIGWYCIVSIIDLVAAAGVAVITLTQKQVAAGMVTGVLYCMASKCEEICSYICYLVSIIIVATPHKTSDIQHGDWYCWSLPISMMTAGMATDLLDYMTLRQHLGWYIPSASYIWWKLLALWFPWCKDTRLLVYDILWEQHLKCSSFLFLGLFTVFGLVIFHVKHYYERYNCQNLYPIPPTVCASTRSVKVLWAVPIAWVGVVICLVASVLWLLLTRALRVIKAKTMLWERKGNNRKDMHPK